MPEVQEKRPRGVPAADETDRFVRQTIGEVLPLRSVRKRRASIRAEVALFGHAPVTATDVDVEAVPLGPVRLLAEVPFADVPGLVAAVPQGRGDGPFFQRQMEQVGGRKDAPLLHARDVVGQRDASRGLAGHDACSRRRAHRARGVGVGEPHAASRQPIEVRGLVEAAAVAAQVHPAHVVDQDEDDVRSRHWNLPAITPSQ